MTVTQQLSYAPNRGIAPRPSTVVHVVGTRVQRCLSEYFRIGREDGELFSRGSRKVEEMEREGGILKCACSIFNATLNQ